MLSFIPPTTSTLFNNFSRHEPWTYSKPIRQSYMDPDFPVHAAQGVTKSKPSHGAYQAGPEYCNAVGDTSGTTWLDPACLIDPTIDNVLRSQLGPLSDPPSSVGSQKSDILDNCDCNRSQHEHPTDRLPSDVRRSPGSWGRRSPIPTTNSSREHFNCQSTQAARLWQQGLQNFASTSPIAQSFALERTFVVRTSTTRSLKTPLPPSGSEASLFPSLNDHPEDQHPLNPTGSVLTQAVQDVIEEALVLYESLRSIKYAPTGLTHSEVSKLF